MSVENYLFWCEIGSGFGEPGGTLLPKILRNSPPPPPQGFKDLIIQHTILDFVLRHTTLYG